MSDKPRSQLGRKPHLNLQLRFYSARQFSAIGPRVNQLQERKLIIVRQVNFARRRGAVSIATVTTGRIVG
jgi:hypothetical protein